ncbi:ester cyclase [Pseudarthrobacter albicanus]|uniref:ester cyclase n=1 Tax=Pseudarthrobacter albicanus TaxID=2823873 RepID=UPI001BA8DDCE|nr:ester cyclase [Pseudarthrobacter albicanus]
MGAEEDMQLMQTFDDAWNAEDWDTFASRHKEDTVLSWLGGQPPTHGVAAHRAESEAMFRTFPDNKVGNRPYKTLFASGDCTFSIASFTGTMTGPMVLADGTEIPPTGKSFEVGFCTVARWDNGQIVEENLFYDMPGMMSQLGLGG